MEPAHCWCGTERPWLDHSVHELNGYKITKVFGERPAHQRHSNMGSITTIAYLDKDQLGEDTLNARGGAIQLFITRPTQSMANFRWFFIVIRGEDDKEKVMEIDLEYQASQLPNANGWWNFIVTFCIQRFETKSLHTKSKELSKAKNTNKRTNETTYTTQTLHVWKPGSSKNTS